MASEKQQIKLQAGFTTFEQAWLCYYMEAVHHKRWNGEKWGDEDGKT